MTLFEEMMEPCTMLDRQTTGDGLGGFTQAWIDGARFNAAIVKDSTVQNRLAEKQGVGEVYTITTPASVQLDFHDVLRRDSDGAIFRVTSNVTDSRTPARASFQFGQVTAERWVLPT